MCLRMTLLYPLQLQKCQQTIEQLRMDKEQLAQQCHDLQQELTMEGEHRQEMSEEVKRLKKELNSRFSNTKSHNNWSNHIYV